MAAFDLFFLLLVVVSLGTLATALVAGCRRQRNRALQILRNLGAGALAYLTVVALVGITAPQRVLRVGQPWCFDDWCLSVESVRRTPAPPRVRYQVSLRVFSRARRVSQSAKGAWVYLIDAQGHRYPPEPDGSAVPLDVRLAPGESVRTSRSFCMPAGATPVGLITGHGPAWLPALIIADEASLFHKRTFVQLE